MQKVLFSIEGKEQKTPIDLVGEQEFKKLPPQEKIAIMSSSINQIHEDYGCKFNWKDSLIVIFKEKQYELFNDVQEIVNSCIIGDEIDAIAFSTSGIDFKTACKEASRLVIEKIVEKERY
ncbi:MAG: hypothetical protein EAX96_04400 [Candidatus Lokiarchaeota archaeon]|nr:hypothetical protein [Candidatus Lokiarchaeota archaeon]